MGTMAMRGQVEYLQLFQSPPPHQEVSEFTLTKVAVRPRSYAMDICEYKIMSGVRHPWEMSRALALRRILLDAGLLNNQSRVLDIGCGDGYTINEVCRHRPVHIDAVDSSLTVELTSRFSEQYQNIRFHNSSAALSAQYDLITAFDVIEHNADGLDFLKSITKLGKPRANILITAPAFQSLFSQHDKMLKHYRRYNLADLTAVAQEAGLEIQQSGYLFSSLLIWRYLAQTCRLPQSNKGLTTWRYGTTLTKAVLTFLNLDNKILRQAHKIGINLPGLSVWLLCKKQP